MLRNIAKQATKHRAAQALFCEWKGRSLSTPPSIDGDSTIMPSKSATVKDLQNQRKAEGLDATLGEEEGSRTPGIYFSRRLLPKSFVLKMVGKCHRFDGTMARTHCLGAKSSGVLKYVSYLMLKLFTYRHLFCPSFFYPLPANQFSLQANVVACLLLFR